MIQLMAQAWAQASEEEIVVRDAKSVVPVIDDLTEAGRRQGLEMTSPAVIHSFNKHSLSYPKAAETRLKGR